MTNKSADELWSIALGELQVQVSRANFNTWLRETKGLSVANGTFTIGAPSSFATEWLQKRLSPLIKKTISKVLEQDTDVSFAVLDSPHEPDLLPTAARSTAGRSPNGRSAFPANQRYSFSTFIVGGSNKFAHAAAVAVAESPGHSYNPLFLYGGVGLGKTHLLHAIGYHCEVDRLRVLYITSEQFTNEFINALRERKTEEFRAKYRSVDVLLIDDIHFIADKEQTQESFFHTFNDLHNANRQIVISSDRPPRSMPLLEDRLRSRFEWGLIADIQPPDLEIRLAILQSKAEEINLLIPSEVLNLIAHRFQSNIRELEGALNRVVAFCHLADSPPTVELADATLTDLLYQSPHSAPAPTRIIEIVTSHFHLSSNDLTGPRRSQEIALARQIAMYIIRMETTLSYSEIGRQLGGRDHSTILHGFDKIAAGIEQNSRLRRTVAEISTLLHA